MDIKNVESKFQILSSKITRLNIDNSFLIYDERKAGKKNIDVSYKICHIEDLEEKKEHFGVLDIFINIFSEIEEQKCVLNLAIRGFFNAPLDLPQEVFEKMLKVNGCTALYSIARGMVGSISSQVFYFGNIVLPMVNFIHFHEVLESSSEQ